MATQKHTNLNVPLERRLELAQLAAFELQTLVASIRPEVEAMMSADSLEHEVIAFTLLERAAVVSDALADLGTVSDDHAHDDSTLSTVLRANHG